MIQFGLIVQLPLGIVSLRIEGSETIRRSETPREQIDVTCSN